jgi:hypothetical protein
MVYSLSLLYSGNSKIKESIYIRISLFRLILTVHRLIVRVLLLSGMGHGPFVILAAVGGQVAGIVAEVADVA